MKEIEPMWKDGVPGCQFVCPSWNECQLAHGTTCLPAVRRLVEAAEKAWDFGYRCAMDCSQATPCPLCAALPEPKEEYQ